MASDDNASVQLIENVRPSLRKFIQVGPVLDLIGSIESDQKELIRNEPRKLKAADLLIDTVIKPPHHAGWFREFVDALSNAGCQYAASYMEKPPDPEVEAENDLYVRLVELLYPTLVRMKTADVCLYCFAQDILSEEDRDNINAVTTTRGPIAGARELLGRLVRRPPGWFSPFLQVLRDTEHGDLVKELTGGDSDDKEENDGVPPMTDNPTGSDVTGEGPAEPGCSTTEETVDEGPDLYNAEAAEPSQQPNSLDPLQPDGNGKAGATGGPKKADLVLRDYQTDVAQPALEGKNIIICLPTGSGKTRVAVYITKAHLDRRKTEGKPRKVVVLVNQVPLVEQHYSKEFGPFLEPTYKVGRVSGDSQLKISFTEIVKNNDVIICTAQILENFLERSNKGEDEGVYLSDLTLIVIDECHHTKKGEVYNHIMMRYLKKKVKNIKLKKEHKEPVAIPQILGLTASPGVGGASRLDKAEEHILRICANLDADRIMTRSLGEFKKDSKIIATAEERAKDPFGDVIKKIMNAIHAHADLNPTCDLDSQNYEQWVVQKERETAKEEDRKVHVCAEHLRKYSEGLQLSNTIRMRDAFDVLNEYHKEEMKRKQAPEEDPIPITDTERFLFNLFKDNEKELQALANRPEFENNSLSELRSQILKEFINREQARGIIFTKTRRSAIALSQWIQENPKFEEVGVKASHLIGGGSQSIVSPMTAAQQKEVLKKFSEGDVNLLIATTVAEEGLDIPQCNFVVRYGLSTNEISMMQAEGRGRAADSTYTLVNVKGSGVAEKESVNEYRKDMMTRAIEKIKSMNQAEYDRRILEFQMQAVVEGRVRIKQQKKKDMKNVSPSQVKFSCRRCFQHVCTGDHIQIIERMHRVNLSAQFSELFIRTENSSLQEGLLDGENNGFISCKGCGLKWGSMMFYRGIECPCLHLKNFVVEYSGKKHSSFKKWSELAYIEFPAFDYVTHASQEVQSSDDDETE